METTQTDIVTDLRAQMETDLQDLLDRDGDALSDHVAEVTKALYESFVSFQLLPQKSILKNLYDELLECEKQSRHEQSTSLKRLFTLLAGRGEDIISSLERMDRLFDEIPVAQSFPSPDETFYLSPSDPWSEAGRKSIYRVTHFARRPPLREIPTRQVAKVYLRVFLSEFTLQLLNSWYHLYGRLLQASLNEMRSEAPSGLSLKQNLREEARSWLQSMQRDFVLDLASHTQRWRKTLKYYGTPLHHLAGWSPQSTDGKIQDLRKTARQLASLWEEKSQLFLNRLLLEVETAHMMSCAEQVVEEKFNGYLQQSQKLIDDLLKELHDLLIKDGGLVQNRKDAEAVNRFVAKVQDLRAQRLPLEAMSRLLKSQSRLCLQEMNLQFKNALPERRGRLEVLSPEQSAQGIRDPKEATAVEVDADEIFDQQIFLSLMVELEEKIESVCNYLEFIFFEVDQNLQKLIHQLRETGTEVDPSNLSSPAEQSQFAYLRAEELKEALIKHLAVNEKLGDEVLAECRQGLEAGLLSVKAPGRRESHRTSKAALQRIGDWLLEKHQFLGTEIKDRLQVSAAPMEPEVEANLKRKMASRTLDAATIRQFVQESYSLDSVSLRLPSLYLRLFSLEPIRDSRFFVAHRKKLDYFRSLIESSSNESQKVLVLGDRGMGKTSLLNVVQNDLGHKCLLRVEGAEGVSPLQAMANQLGCSANPASLLQRLGKTQNYVLIDNFDQLVVRLPIRDIEAFLQFVQQAPAQTHWILTMTRSHFLKMDRALSIRSHFSKVIDLQPLEFEQCQPLIMARQRLSGLEINYPSELVNSWKSRLGLGSADEVFFKNLYEQSGGELRQLLAVWLKSVESVGPEDIHLQLKTRGSAGLPMISDFSLLQKHLLNQLYNFHQMGVEPLGRQMGVSPSLIEAELHYLESCGLLRVSQTYRQSYEIPNYLTHAVGLELRKEELF